MERQRGAAPRYLILDEAGAGRCPGRAALSQGPAAKYPRDAGDERMRALPFPTTSR